MFQRQQKLPTLQSVLDRIHHKPTNHSAAEALKASLMAYNERLKTSK